MTKAKGLRIAESGFRESWRRDVFASAPIATAYEVAKPATSATSLIARHLTRNKNCNKAQQPATSLMAKDLGMTIFW
jgi:hypothetical protein